MKPEVQRARLRPIVLSALVVITTVGTACVVGYAVTPDSHRPKLSKEIEFEPTSCESPDAIPLVNGPMRHDGYHWVNGNVMLGDDSSDILTLGNSTLGVLTFHTTARQP